MFWDCFDPVGLFGWLDWWSQPRAQAIALMTGLGILALLLMVLAFTRWGQAKPLSKCLALSVFAHILLMAYAYGIRLFSDEPTGPREETIRLTVVDTDDPSPSQAEPDKPWEDYTTEAPLAPEPGLPSRIESENARPIDRSVESATVPLEVPELLDAPSMTEPDLPDAEFPPDARDDPTPPAIAQAPAADVPEPHAEPQPDPLPISPPETEPERLSTAVAEATPLPLGATQSITDLDTTDGQLQRLMDIPLPTEVSEAAPDLFDDTTQALNNAATSSSPPGAVPPITSAAPTTTTDDSNLQTAPPGPDADWELVSIRRSGDGRAVPLAYRGRMTTDRLALAAKNGGSIRTEQAVDAALKWLAENQNADGGWDCDVHGGGQETRVLGHDRKGAGADADMAVTGLALLAFLGAGHTHLDGEHRTTVQRGLEFLLRNQATDGNLAANARLFAKMYCHGMATLALGEAYAMTGDTRLLPYVKRAVGYTVRSQHSAGGWRYQPGDRGDTSQFGWQVMALRSAELGGDPTPAATRGGMIRFLSSVSTGPYRGLASYRPGTGPTRTMTAEALACRLFLQVDLDRSRTDEAVRFVMQEVPTAGPANLYYWYYATLALFQVGGEAWETWNVALQERLLASQQTTGALAGSWPTATIWGGYGGRVYTTAMGALCLEVYYRHLPLYGHGS